MLRNVLRAIFWTAVTAAFVPAGFSAAPDGAFARETRQLVLATDALSASQDLTRQAGHQTRNFCNDQAEACAVGQQLASFSSIVAGVVGEYLPVVFIVPMLFVAGAVMSFTTGTSWGTFAILIPIGVPLIQTLGLPPSLVVAAILGGGIFGDHCSPISDTTAVSSLAAGCDVLTHVKTQFPYALLAGGLTLVAYFIASLVMIG